MESPKPYAPRDLPKLPDRNQVPATLARQLVPGVNAQRILAELEMFLRHGDAVDGGLQVLSDEGVGATLRRGFEAQHEKAHRLHDGSSPHMGAALTIA